MARDQPHHTPATEQAPAEGRQREEQPGRPPPPKKKGGGRGGGGRAETAHSHQTARQQHRRWPNPTPRGHRRQDPQRGTGAPPSQNRQHQARNSGPPGKGAPKQADTHHEKTKKKPAAQPERKETGGETTRPVTGTPSNRKKKSAKNTPRQPSPEGRGTAEIRAQHARPHRTPEPETAGGKGNAHETTHVPKAGRHQSPTTNTTTAGNRGTTPQTEPKHTHPRPQPRLAGVNKTHDQPQPGPNHKRKPTVVTRSRGGPATGRCGGHAQVSRQAKHYAHRGINALMSCDKAFQDPCHSATRERKYVQQHIRICTHGVKTGLG